MQFFSLFSDEFKCISAPVSKVSTTGSSKIPLNRFSVGYSFQELPAYNSYMCKAQYSAIVCHGSDHLKHYFSTVIIPVMYNITIKNHANIFPCYTYSGGLCDLINRLSQFDGSDRAIIENLKVRLQSYCGRIEDVVFDSHGLFITNLSHARRVELVKTYADFLKEFYAENAPSFFYNQSRDNQLMQQVMPGINWNWYDGRDYVPHKRVAEQRYAGSVNGNLGQVYYAMEQGDSSTAYAMGQEKVQTFFSGRMWGKTEEIASVFEKYPELKRIVEEKYLTDQKACSQRKQVALQQEAKIIKSECENNIDQVIACDILQARCKAAQKDLTNFRSSKYIHKVFLENSKYIDTAFLSNDKKGIIFEGSALQHCLVDEAISVVDMVVCSHLHTKIQDAVVDLANGSLLSNKGGNAITASRMLDACWVVIDFGKKIISCTYTSVGIYAPLIVGGIAEGLGESLHDVAHAVCHPIETVQDLANSLVVVGYYLGKAVFAAAEYESVIDLSLTHPHLAKEMIQGLIDEPSMLPILYEQVKKLSAKDVARGGTKFAADIMLLHGINKLIPLITKDALPAFVNSIRKGMQSTKVVVAVEGIPANCAQEISSLMSSLEKVSGRVDNMVNINNISELLQSFNILKYDSSIGNVKKLEEAIKILKSIPGSLTKDGALFKALEYGQRIDVLMDSKKILEISGRLATARGAMYEVEKAIELIEAGEKIIHMGRKIGGREFDIVTSTKLIECKNIDWSTRVGRSAEKMKSDLGDWKRIAKDNNKIFELHSKNFIPQEWKDVFIKMGINFVEDNVL